MLFRHLQERTRAVVDAEAAMSDAATEARKVGLGHLDENQSSHFSKGSIAPDDTYLVQSILNGCLVTFDVLYAWVRRPNFRPPYEMDPRWVDLNEVSDLHDVRVD